MGCPPVTAFGVAHPGMVSSMILYWPVGGAKYRISSHQRFAEHLAFVQRATASTASWRWSPRTASRSAPIRAAARGRPSSSATAPLPTPMPSRTATHYKLDLRGHVPRAVRPRHRARRRAGGSDARSTSRRWSSRATTPRTPLRRRAISRNACRARSIGTCRSGSRPKRKPTRAFWSSLRTPKRHSAPDVLTRLGTASVILSSYIVYLIAST